jgi:hypothetical protein
MTASHKVESGQLLVPVTDLAHSYQLLWQGNTGSNFACINVNVSSLNKQNESSKIFSHTTASQIKGQAKRQ